MADRSLRAPFSAFADATALPARCRRGGRPGQLLVCTAPGSRAGQAHERRRLTARLRRLRRDLGALLVVAGPAVARQILRPFRPAARPLEGVGAVAEVAERRAAAAFGAPGGGLVGAAAVRTAAHAEERGAVPVAAGARAGSETAGGNVAVVLGCLHGCGRCIMRGSAGDMGTGIGGVE